MSEKIVPERLLDRWQRLRSATVSRIDAGLINDTFLVSTENAKYVLQCLHPVFDAEVNCDIDVVTKHLAKQGLTTPLIIPTDDGALWAERDGLIWRLQSHVKGHTFHAITNSSMAFEAGRMTAGFHTALSNFQYDYQSGRGQIHDTSAHLQYLVTALDSYSDHRLYGDVEALARPLLAINLPYEEIDKLPLRHCHGDLKISNILFDDDNKARCLIDLDTVNRMPWPLEMGDALRSWCNPSSEEQPAAQLNLALLDAAISGYASALPAWLGSAESDQLINGLARICLELSARFLADALNENYFGWNSDHYPTRGDHNLARARAMSALYEDVKAKQPEAEKIVARRLRLD